MTTMPTIKPHFKLKLPQLWATKTAAADQQRFINAPQRISIAATGTKTGKTLGCSIWLLFNATTQPKTRWWWVAPSHYQAEIGFERVKDMIPLGKAKVNLSTRTIRFPNESIIEFKTGEKPNNLFGQAIQGGVFDEASRMREEAWSAFISTMAQTRGRIRVASNTDLGRSNWFYGLYMKGLSQDFPDYCSWSIKSYENPHNPPELVTDLRDALPEMAYQSLVEAIFPEDSLTVFRNIDANLVDWGEITPPFIKMPNGDKSYVFGLDLARKRDFTVLLGIDLEDNSVVYFQRMHGTLWENQMEQIQKISALYNHGQILLDSTGVGDPIFERLRLLGCNVEGYQFTNTSKQRLMDRLSLGFEGADLRIPANLSVLVNEVRAYEYEISDSGVVRFVAPNLPGHADAVTALALGYWAASNPFAVGYASVEKREDRSTKTHRSDKWKRGRGF